MFTFYNRTNPNNVACNAPNRLGDPEHTPNQPSRHQLRALRHLRALHSHRIALSPHARSHIDAGSTARQIRQYFEAGLTSQAAIVKMEGI